MKQVRVLYEILPSWNRKDYDISCLSKYFITVMKLFCLSIMIQRPRPSWLLFDWLGTCTVQVSCSHETGGLACAAEKDWNIFSKLYFVSKSKNCILLSRCNNYKTFILDFSSPTWQLCLDKLDIFYTLPNLFEVRCRPDDVYLIFILLIFIA